MTAFKKTKKQSPIQKFYNDLTEEIVFAIEHDKNAIYVPVSDEKEDWLLNFAEERNYFVRADHVREGTTYYKMWGWVKE